jgi:SIR2-like domain
MHSPIGADYRQFANAFGCSFRQPQPEATTVNGLEPPYEIIMDALLSGKVVPFFGSAASAVYRPPGVMSWEPGKPFLPFGAELASALARAANYDAAGSAYKAAESELVDAAADAALKALPGATRDQIGEAMLAAIKPILNKHFGGPPALALAASYFVQVQASREMLESKLHQAFDVTAEPGSLHKRLAAIENIPLYITTNYDDLLERALAPRDPHILVDRVDKGLIIKMKNGGPELIDRTGGDLRNRLTNPETGKPTAPILFKMHGSVDRKDRINDSYLITEEDYVDYLGRDQGHYVPPYIEELMRRKNFLFLGYSLEDWNVRVILRKLLESMPSGAGDTRGEKVRFWAIVRGLSEAEQKVWQSQNLNVYQMDLLTFTERLVAELDRSR